MAVLVIYLLVCLRHITPMYFHFHDSRRLPFASPPYQSINYIAYPTYTTIALHLNTARTSLQSAVATYEMTILDEPTLPHRTPLPDLRLYHAQYDERYVTLKDQTTLAARIHRAQVQDVMSIY